MYTYPDGTTGRQPSKSGQIEHAHGRRLEAAKKQYIIKRQELRKKHKGELTPEIKKKHHQIAADHAAKKVNLDETANIQHEEKGPEAEQIEREKEDYLVQFTESVAGLPKSFDEFVDTATKKEADTLLLSDEVTGYNIDSYGISGKGGYSKHLKTPNRLVYHQYIEHPEHGQELLKRLQNQGLSIPYELSHQASTVLWDDSWDEEDEVKIEKIGDKTVGRSLQYALVFQPGDKHEADRLAEFIEDNARAGQKDAIQHSWYVPDVRSTFEKKVDAHEKNVLNLRAVGDQEILILSKRHLDGFEHHDLWLNPSLSEFIKSIQWRPGKIPSDGDIAERSRDDFSGLARDLRGSGAESVGLLYENGEPNILIRVTDHKAFDGLDFGEAGRDHVGDDGERYNLHVSAHGQKPRFWVSFGNDNPWVEYDLDEHRFTKEEKPNDWGGEETELESGDT